MSCSHDASYGGACVLGGGARLCDAEGEGTGV